jgi:uncharacterized protein YukE
MAKKGMNPESVDQMAQRIDEAGEEVMNHFTQARDAVTDLDWTGEDRDRYVSQFEGELSSQVEALKAAAHTLAERARANSEEQRTASA